MVPGERAPRPGDEPFRARQHPAAESGRVCRASAGSTARAGDRIVQRDDGPLDIRPRRPELKASALSGGNQQKVILAKWLVRRVGVLLLEEPTQGIDVAAKAQIHALIRDFVARGGGVLVNSSDLAELARLCDSVLAVRQGRITRFARARPGPRRADSCARRSAASMTELFRSKLAGQMPLISLIALVRGHGLADAALSLAAQPHQHPGAVLDHGGDRHGHDLRDRRRRLRPLGRLDRRARGLRRQHGDAAGRDRRRRGRRRRWPAPSSDSPTASSSPGSTSTRSSPRSAPWCWCAASCSSSPAARRCRAKSGCRTPSSPSARIASSASTTSSGCRPSCWPCCPS